MIDHAPMDIHVGSIAIQKFIDKKQPFLTLHGHVHESTRLTGHWKERFGKTFSFTAAHDGPELALIRFDTDDLKNATRELIAVS
jgi:Icc-related predicted phosphoesterase